MSAQATQSSQPSSVGIVEPRTLRIDTPLPLSNGSVLDQYELVYETYGELNASRSNAILICHALSGDHHAAGRHHESYKRPGWWDHYIGPGKPIDTNLYHVVSLNNLGGCAGSTGPASINPATGRPWGPDFPRLRVRDWVNSQAVLADALGIERWAAVIGGSLGGMQAMRWALEYPHRVANCVIIASAMKLTAQNIAFNEIARQAIEADAGFQDGRFLENNTLPGKGLAIARMIGHITYLSDDAMGNKFGRELRSGSFDIGAEELVEFEVQRYLRYQGESFSTRFDANTYILMTRALDYFDLAREYNDDAVQAFSHAQCNFLVMSFSSDWRFSPQRSEEIVNALIGAGKNVSYVKLESEGGHDAFLLPHPRYESAFKHYLHQAHQKACAGGGQH